jgi:hypothetical protein
MLQQHARALGRALHAQSPYTTGLLIAGIALCTIESALLPGPRTPAYFVYLAGLLCGFALIAGSAWQLAVLALSRVGRAAYAIWPALGLGAALQLANYLSAFTQIDGRYSRLAKLTIAGSVGAGLLLGGMLAAVQPTQRHPRGWLATRGAPLRGTAFALWIVLAIALSVADQRLYVGLYPDAHVALRLCAALVLTLALVGAEPLVVLPRLGKAGIAAAIALLMVPVVLLDESQVATVEAFLSRPWSSMLLRGARNALDFDRDGFSWALGGGDCNDLDARVNPTAREIPDNGIDDNCSFGDRKHSSVSTATATATEQKSPMNIVLITVDTLRWDRLGSNDPRYGAGGRDTMPELTRWTKAGVRFSRAYSPGTWTSIALGAVLRGVYARRLTFTPYYETTAYRLLRPPLAQQLKPDEMPARMFPLAFSDPHPALAESLQRRGMKTMAVVDDGFSQMLSEPVGIARGFDRYDEVNGEAKGKKRKRRRDDVDTVAMAIDALHDASGQRFFLWVHLFGPHAPSRKYEGIKHYGDSVEDAYDHEVRSTDTQLGRLLAALDQVPDPTAVFVTADHGEEFFSTYRSHGTDLSEQVLRVPLSAHVPGWKPGTVKALVSLVDLMPTILALTHTPAPQELDGINLAKLVHGHAPERRVLFSDVWQFGSRGRAFTDLSAAFDGKRKLVLNRLDHSFSIYDQAHDDALAPVEDASGEQLTRQLLSYLEEGSGPPDNDSTLGR